MSDTTTNLWMMSIGIQLDKYCIFHCFAALNPPSSSFSRSSSSILIIRTILLLVVVVVVAAAHLIGWLTRRIAMAHVPHVFSPLVLDSCRILNGKCHLLVSTSLPILGQCYCCYFCEMENIIPLHQSLTSAPFVRPAIQSNHFGTPPSLANRDHRHEDDKDFVGCCHHCVIICNFAHPLRVHGPVAVSTLVLLL